MKTLKRLAVEQLNDLERLSMKELSNFVGGSGCIWDALGYAYTFCDGAIGNEGDPKNNSVFSSQFLNAWKRFGGSVHENGDPYASQAGLLFDFIAQNFGTTGSSWGSSNWQGMINGSSCGMALVMIGDSMNQHAHIISGDVRYDGNGRAYYWDPNEEEKVYVDQILYGTGLSEKTNQ